MIKAHVSCYDKMNEEDKSRVVGVGDFPFSVDFEVYMGLVPKRSILEGNLAWWEFVEAYKKQLSELDVAKIGNILKNKILLFTVSDQVSWFCILLKWLKDAGFNCEEYVGVKS